MIIERTLISFQIVGVWATKINWKNYFQNLRSRPLSYAEYYNNYPDPNPLINKSENSEDLGFGESDEEEPVTTVNMSIVHDRKDNYR